MAFWADFYKYFTYAFKPDPLSRKRAEKTIDGVGVTQPDAIPDLRADNWWGGGNRGQVRLRDSNDFIDLSSVTNRQSRYKEYERLRFVAEIEAALDILADESCVSGDTPVVTPFGKIPIQKLAETKKPGEKFLVYCYDFDKGDYTLGWGHDARKVKTVPTTKVFLDNGVTLKLTSDHKVLLRSGEWVQAGTLKEGDELMPFNRVRVEHGLNSGKSCQFPRIYTFADGWKHERQFVDEWRMGDKANYDPRLKVILKCLSEGLQLEQAKKFIGTSDKKADWKTTESILRKNGFSYREIKSLNARYPKQRRVIGVAEGETIDVYDLSVDEHENFATDGCILHNCQLGDNGHTFDIICKNETVKKELEYMFHKLIRVDRKIWNWAKNLYCMGDWFGEVVIDPENPKLGILKINPLPADSIYRIETTKGKLLEFQQSKEGPDYQSLARVDVTQANDSELAQATAIRFAPEQIIHIRIGDDRKTFYPYGVSIIEPARGPANQLRLMEDAMVVYRLCLVGDTRIRTTRGYKLMKDIKEGDFVYSYTAQDGTRPTRVAKFIDNDIQDVFTVRSKHVEITGTKTHPILVNRGGIVQYVDIQNLTLVDELILTTQDKEEKVGMPLFEGEIWAKLSDEQRKVFRLRQYKNKSELLRQCHDFGRAKQFLYTKGKALPLEKAKRICEVFGLDKDDLVLVNKNQRNVERLSLPAYVNEDFARLFGFLCGDGFMHNGSQFGFAAGDDQTVNSYYKNLLQKYFGKVRFEQDKRRSEGQGKYVVDSTFGCSLFTKMGYINDHDINRIPQWVFTTAKSIRRAFVEGLSDADGCERHTKAGTWFSTIELSNKEMIRDVKELWSSIGLSSGKLGERYRENGHEIEPGRIMPPTTSYLVTISDCLLPERERVLEVVPAGRERVYDITVDDPRHNFIANGIPVHNTRAPERRVFYIDVGGLPPNKAEAFIERLKDQLRKKKMYTNRASQTGGGGSVEERWHAPSADEDYWLPIRPNGNTRIETLPGAQNLGEVDDALYFRNKLLTALHLPKNYLSQDDPNVSKMTLSSQDVKFARYIERLQTSLADGLLEIAERHLTLRGFPQEMWDDLDIRMTPPSEWREMSRMEVMQARYSNASTVTQGQPVALMSRYDALVDILKYQPDRAREMSSRAKMQGIEDQKITLISQSPELSGVGQPGNDEQEMGGEAGGPNPMLGDQEGGNTPPPEGGAGGEDNKTPPPPDAGGSGGGMEGGPAGAKAKPESKPLPEPEEEDIKKYDLEIRDFSKEKDEEEIDPIELGEL